MKVIFEWNGEQKTLGEWAKVLGVNQQTLYSRIYNYKWTVEKAFTTPAMSLTLDTPEQL